MARASDDYADCCNQASNPVAEKHAAEKAYYAQSTSGVLRPDDNYIVDQLFTYHPPTPYSGPKFENIREAAKYFAKVLLNNVPAGADRTAAIRKIREAVMTANAGIALNGLSL